MALTTILDWLKIPFGALLGFGASWWFWWRAEKDNRLAIAYELFFRAQLATETIAEIHRVLTVNLSKVGSEHMPQHWQVVQLPTGFDWSARCEFNARGLAILALAGKFERINDLLELARLHDLLLITTAEFSKRQEAFTEELKKRAEVDVEGTTVSLRFDPDAFKPLAPDMMRVDDLLLTLIAKATEGAVFAKAVVSELGPELRDSLNDKRFRGRIEYREKAP